MLKRIRDFFLRIFTSEPFPANKKWKGDTIGDHYDVEYQVSEKRGAVYIGFPEKGEDERNPNFPEDQ